MSEEIMKLTISCAELDYEIKLETELQDHTKIISHLAAALAQEAVDHPMFMCVMLSAAHNAVTQKPGIAMGFAKNILAALEYDLENPTLQVHTIDPSNDSIELEGGIEMVIH